MKRYLILGTMVAAVLLLVLLWPRPASNTSTPGVSQPPPQALVPANSSNQLDEATAEPEQDTPANGSNALAAGENPDQLEKALRFYNAAHDTPIAFYGLVVDQDSNALQNVSVDLEVVEQYTKSSFEVKGKVTHLQRKTEADGRFEVTG